MTNDKEGDDTPIEDLWIELSDQESQQHGQGNMKPTQPDTPPLVKEIGNLEAGTITSDHTKVGNIIRDTASQELTDAEALQMNTNPDGVGAEIGSLADQIAQQNRDNHNQGRGGR